MIIAVLDTNVLWPSLQRDFLLSLAAEGIFRPVWSTAILDELREAEEIKLTRRGVSAEEAGRRATALVTTMTSVFEDSLAAGWERFEGTFGLPDPDDEHVLAAVVAGGASTLVTHNHRDFPPTSLPDGVVVQPPAVFAERLASVAPEAAADAVRALAARSGHLGPQLSYDDILRHQSARYGMHAVRVLLQAIT